MNRIDSVNNKTVKLIASLKMKKYRDKEGLFVAEGERNVSDGAKKEAPLMVFVEDGYKGKTDFECEVYSVPRSVFEKMSDTKSPQGILGVFRKKTGFAVEIEEGNILILNGVADPGNVGTLLRTAAATGFKNIIADKTSADIFAPKTVRSAMSAVFSLQIVISENLCEDIAAVKNKGYNVFCGDLGGTDIYETDMSGKAAVVVGNEANGPEDEVVALSDVVLSIPMEEGTESLNAAVAGSVIMYESVRQKRGKR